MITIEPLSAEHFEAVARWLANPQINRWLNAEWRQGTASATMVAIAVRNRRNRLFLVRCDSEPCGVVALGDLDPIDRTGMVWYFLGERQLGSRGVISDALHQLIRFAFSELGLASVHAWAMEGNDASVRVLKKNGFRYAGTLRKSASLDGQQSDRVYFDLTPADINQPAFLANTAARTNGVWSKTG